MHSASLSLFLHFLLQYMDWQLEGKTICVAMSWGLLVSFKDARDSSCIGTKVIALTQYVKYVGVIYMVVFP